MKNIVICCDGTGNEYGRNNTNVVETYVLAEKDASQVAYSDPGGGTGGWDDERGFSNITLIGFERFDRTENDYQSRNMPAKYRVMQRNPL